MCLFYFLYPDVVDYTHHYCIMGYVITWNKFSFTIKEASLSVCSLFLKHFSLVWCEHGGHDGVAHINTPVGVGRGRGLQTLRPRLSPASPAALCGLPSKTIIWRQVYLPCDIIKLLANSFRKCINSWLKCVCEATFQRQSDGMHTH